MRGFGVSDHCSMLSTGAHIGVGNRHGYPCSHRPQEENEQLHLWDDYVNLIQRRPFSDGKDMESRHGFGVADHCPPMLNMGEGYYPGHPFSQIDKNIEYSSHRRLGEKSFLDARISPTWPPWYYYSNFIQQSPFTNGKDMELEHGFGVADHCPPMLNMGEGYYPEHLFTPKDKNIEYSSHRPLGRNKQPLDQCSFADQKRLDYYKRLEESEEFNVGDFPGCIDPWEAYTRPITLNRSTPEWILKKLTDYSNLARDEYNYNRATKYQFAKLLKANCRGGYSMEFDITFQANDVACSRPKNFQAHLFTFRGEVDAVLCRPEP